MVAINEDRALWSVDSILNSVSTEVASVCCLNIKVTGGQD
jgi:hypothetical protein